MKYYSIQYLRALAAVSVVLGHASVSLLAGKAALVNIPFGTDGVDLFFVISGFIMFATTERKTPSVRNFYARRIIRIVPLYFLLTTFGFLIASLWPGAFATLSSSPLDYVRSIFFVPFYNAKLNAIQPELAQGWTLNYEMFFYAVFGLALFFDRGKRVLVCTVVFLSLALAGQFLHLSGAILSTYTDTIVIEFVFGVVLGYVFSGRAKPLNLAIPVACLLAVGIGLYVWHLLVLDEMVPEFFMVGIPAAAAVGGAVWLESVVRVPRLPNLLLIGDASYSLYLTHGFVLGALRRLWALFFDIHSIATHVVFIAVSIPIAVAAAVAVYEHIERPVINFLKARARVLRPA